MRTNSLIAALLGCAALAACASAPEPPPAGTVMGTMRPYKIGGRTYTPRYDPDYEETGLASWYGPGHHGKPTADGERFDQNEVSAAHKTLPLPSIVEVKNLENGKKIRVRVNDRGPFVDGRIIDLSKEAAEQLGMLQRGVAKVRVKYLGPAERKGVKVARR
ncbi:MAG TPA: septal ring lytic transglycosylase RlpA family protein [Caulobacteraceae bacterium]